MGFEDLSIQTAGLVAAAIGLGVATLVLLTRSVNALRGFSDALSSYAQIISGLNEELKQSYEQRRELREANEALSLQVDGMGLRLQKAERSLETQEQKVVALQKDKGELKDALADLQAQAEKDAASHAQVVRALTEKIDALTQDVAHEKRARQQTERDLQAQIRALTEKNKALEEENERLKAALDQAADDKTSMQREIVELRGMIEALRNGKPAGTPETKTEKEQGDAN